MEFVQIVGIGIVVAILVILLKEEKPEIAVALTIITSGIIFFIVIYKVEGVIQIINKYIDKSCINKKYFNILLKIVGISYIAEFGSEICKDAGVGAISSKIELLGKIIIVTLSIPIITSLIELILQISI